MLKGGATILIPSRFHLNMQIKFWMILIQLSLPTVNLIIAQLVSLPMRWLGNRFFYFIYLFFLFFWGVYVCLFVFRSSKTSWCVPRRWHLTSLLQQLATIRSNKYLSSRVRALFYSRKICVLLLKHIQICCSLGIPIRGGNPFHYWYYDRSLFGNSSSWASLLTLCLIQLPGEGGR